MPDEYAICVGTFYEELAERLVNGAIEGFDEEGVSAASVSTFEVPGAFELPLAARWCLRDDGAGARASGRREAKPGSNRGASGRRHGAASPPGCRHAGRTRR